METNRVQTSGHWRAYLDTDPMGMQKHLFVMKENAIAKVSEHGLTLYIRPNEAAALGDEDQFMAWTDFLDEDIIDMWKAIGKTLGVWNEQPGRAYEQGLSEGRADVLREWNDELRGIVKDLGQALLKDEYRGEALD